MTHESHPEIRKRLQRAEGHLRRIVRMLDEGRPCTDLAQQLHAVERAIHQAKKTLIHDHIDHCLADAAGSGRDRAALVAEFRDISKYL
jgi:uncharacterized protein